MVAAVHRPIVAAEANNCCGHWLKWAAEAALKRQALIYDILPLEPESDAQRSVVPRLFRPVTLVGVSDG